LKKLDLNNWNRKEHFEFFSKMDDPFAGIVTEVECTNTFELSRERSISFYALYLHKAMRSVNEIEEFRYRIKKGEVVIYDNIHVSATVGRKDETFGFSFLEYDPDFSVFYSGIKEENQRVRSEKGLCLTENASRDDTVHVTAIPWNRFTGLKHPGNFKNPGSVPRISFGKTSSKDGRIMLPLSIEVHHGLMDGVHISKFLETYESFLAEDQF